MRIVLIADTFPPLRTSGAVQIRDLVREFVRQGHILIVLLPDSEIREAWKMEDLDGAMILRLKAPRIKEIGHFRRTVGELLMPLLMLVNFWRSQMWNEVWDGVVWYSPSIFLGPLVHAIKKRNKCKGYLILRDIFPNWAVDMGLMKRGLHYYFFSAVANYQYSIANVIGVQSPGNKIYFDNWIKTPGRQVEVLSNWLGVPAVDQCSIRVSETPFAGRKVLVYAGNMGVAQGIKFLVDLAVQLRSRIDVGILIVGRGSEVFRLKRLVHDQALENVLFFDEIHPDEISDLYAQCTAGIVLLDPKHKSHNIPGKFLSYMQNGLPVLARINSNSDLEKMILSEEVGQVCDNSIETDLLFAVQRLLNQIEADKELPSRCKRLFHREFAVQTAVNKIILALSPLEENYK